MKFIHRIFREKLTSIIFVAGLAVSCFILINFADLYAGIQKENEAYYSFEYVFRAYLNQYDEAYLDTGWKPDADNYSRVIIDRLRQETVGNTYIEMSVYLNNSKAFKDASIIMKLNETAGLKCTEEYDASTANGIIIGESILDYTTVSNGQRVLIIDEFEMPVIAVLENNTTGGYDNSIYLFWDNMDSEVKAYFENEMPDAWNLYITHKSHNDITGAFYQLKDDLTLQNIVVSHVRDVREYKEVTEDYRNEWYREFNKIFLGGSLIFSLFNCFSVSYLWLIRRKRELALRKAFGYSSGQITGLVFGDIIKLCIPACIMALVVQLIYNLICGNQIFDMYVLIRIALVCMGMFVISVLTSIYLLEHINRVPAAKVLAERRG